MRFCIICLTLMAGILFSSPIWANNEAILSQKDVRLYQNIFAAHEKGKFQEARALFQKVSDKRLAGYVLFDRYFSKRYKTKASEITSWLKKYDELPVAADMYALGVQKKAKVSARPPRGIFGSSSGSCSYTPREDPIDLLIDKNFSYLSGKKRKEALKTMRRIERFLKNGKTLNARRIIDSPATKNFSSYHLDAAKTALAFSYFLDGENEKAASFIQAVLKRSQKRIPVASWVAGLVAWRAGEIQQAAGHFEFVSNAEGALPLLSAGASFWAARAYLRLGQFEKVKPLLMRAAEQSNTFYGLLALRLLGRDPELAWETTLSQENGDVALGFSHPALERFYVLRQLGREEWAQKELSKLYLESDDEAKALLLMISDKNGFSQDLLRISGQLKNKKGRYPAPNWVPQGGWQLDKALVYAFVLQESCFNTRAKSSVGALGLMQIMPQTGRELARMLQFPWSLKRLSDPEYNLALGQKYLLRLMEMPAVQNNLIYTAVAYNAGPGNLIKWKKKTNYEQDPLLFLESIPSRETRAFVERILVNYWVYRSLMEEAVPSWDETASGKWPIFRSVEFSSDAQKK